MIKGARVGYSQGTCHYQILLYSAKLITNNTALKMQHVKNEDLTPMFLDYPPEKLAYLMATPSYCRKKAAKYGPYTEQLISEILSDHAMRNLRKAQGILRLGEKYGHELERASKRALAFGNYRYKSLKIILEKGLCKPEDAPPVSSLSPLGRSFLRPVTYFAEEVRP
ncbi:MAG: hypothetical protein SVW57_13345 [Thermodesulfobacteriota bacterium]|nr:hypothetical protein [Thermodesulfobacteriota bacterium]